MPRMHGETARAYAQRRQFESERRAFARGIEQGYGAALAGIGVPVEVRVACPCLFRPYPHIINRDDPAHAAHRHSDNWRVLAPVPPLSVGEHVPAKLVASGFDSRRATSAARPLRTVTP